MLYKAFSFRYIWVSFLNSSGFFGVCEAFAGNVYLDFVFFGGGDEDLTDILNYLITSVYAQFDVKPKQICWQRSNLIVAKQPLF